MRKGTSATRWGSRPICICATPTAGKSRSCRVSRCSASLVPCCCRRNRRSRPAGCMRSRGRSGPRSARRRPRPSAHACCWRTRTASPRTWPKGSHVPARDARSCGLARATENRNAWKSARRGSRSARTCRRIFRDCCGRCRTGSARQTWRRLTWWCISGVSEYRRGSRTHTARRTG